MQKERTKNGMLYTFELVSSNGGGFLLFPDPEHTDADIQAAKMEITNNRDVVWLRVAGEMDRDYLYKTDVFADPDCKPLPWYEIEDDIRLLRKYRLAGKPAAEYVKCIVLPRREQTKARNLARFGETIYNF